MYRITTLLLAGASLGVVALPALPTGRLEAADAPKQWATQVAKATFYAQWTYYKKNTRTGVVTRVSSGRAGPYTTRREAQSAVDDYLGSGTTSGGYYYYYSARVVS